jgi:2,5-dihydroxypyridine 5,6-dioxygenase
MIPLRRAIQRLAREHLLLQRGETLAIISQGEVGELADLAWQEALRTRSKPIGVQLPATRRSNNGLPTPLLALLKTVDVFLIFSPVLLREDQVTTISAGTARGLQVAALDCEALLRVLSADAREVADRSRRIADIFSIGKTLEVRTPMGTEMSLSVVRAKGLAQTGMVRERSQVAWVPAGMASVVPVQGSVQGVIVVDRITGRAAPLQQPVHIHVKDGVVTQVKGGAAAQPVRNLLRNVGKGQRYVVRVSFGTNRGAEVGHSALEDEVAMGTLHVSLGANPRDHGQRPEVRLLLTESTLIIDKHTIVDGGKIVV